MFPCSCWETEAGPGVSALVPRHTTQAQGGSGLCPQGPRGHSEQSPLTKLTEPGAVVPEVTPDLSGSDSFPTPPCTVPAVGHPRQSSESPEVTGRALWAQGWGCVPCGHVHGTSPWTPDPTMCQPQPASARAPPSARPAQGAEAGHPQPSTLSQQVPPSNTLCLPTRPWGQKCGHPQPRGLPTDLLRGTFHKGKRCPQTALLSRDTGACVAKTLCDTVGSGRSRLGGRHLGVLSLL